MKTERFELRMDEETLANIDRWRGGQDDVPSRAEAIRRLVETGLSMGTAVVPKASPYEALTLAMLCDLQEHLMIKNGVDPELVRSALSGGHYWSLGWELPGVIHSHADSRENVTEVVDYLDMWTFIESGFSALSKKDQDQVKADAGRTAIAFPGFDGNNESEHYSIARHLIDDLKRWSNFKGRDLNSHMPSLDGYRRMFRVFEPMRARLSGMRLNAAQIVELMKAREFPKAA